MLFLEVIREIGKNLYNAYTHIRMIKTETFQVNPFKDLPIYNVDLVLKYNNKRRDEMPPHIFAVANEALRNMLYKRQNQVSCRAL